MLDNMVLLYTWDQWWKEICFTIIKYESPIRQQVEILKTQMVLELGVGDMEWWET